MELVRDGLTAKQIARELGISHRTVEQHIAAAIKTLGVSNRIAAVTRLNEIERDEELAGSVAPFMLPAERVPVESELIDDETHMSIDEVSSAQSQYNIVPPLGGKPNTATRAERIAWMIRIAVICTMATCLVILSIMAVTSLASIL